MGMTREVARWKSPENAFWTGQPVTEAPSEQHGGEREHASQLLWRWKLSGGRARETLVVGHDKTGGTAN